MALLWFCFSVQHRSSSSDIEISVYPDTKLDFRYRTLSTDRPGGQPISDVEDLRRPIRPHYANLSVLRMSTDSQVSVRVAHHFYTLVSYVKSIFFPLSVQIIACAKHIISTDRT